MTGVAATNSNSNSVASTVATRICGYRKITTRHTKELNKTLHFEEFLQAKLISGRETEADGTGGRERAKRETDKKYKQRWFRLRFATRSPLNTKVPHRYYHQLGITPPPPALLRRKKSTSCFGLELWEPRVRINKKKIETTESSP